MPRRTTLQDVATQAGVHIATVSRALARHPGIPPSTSKRIHQIAEKLGYVPDPMLSALSAYRTRLKNATFHGVLAWVTNSFTRDGWDTCETFRRYKIGCHNRAEKLGYHLEEFWLRELSVNWRRASEILLARNIRGLILAPQPRAKVRVRLDWPRFAGVTFGQTLAWPPLHRVTDTTFLSMQTAVRQARMLGYRRLGLVSCRTNDDRVNHGWMGGFLVQQRHWSKSEHVPVLEFTKDVIDARKLFEWVKKYRPDAIVCHNPVALVLLEKNGYRIPDDFGYLSPSLSDHPKRVAGIDERPQEMGEVAVNVVTEMISRGEWGIPTLTQSFNVDGEWRDGETLPRRNL